MEIRQEHVFELHRRLLAMAVEYEKLAKSYDQGSWYNGFYRGHAKACRRNAHFLLQLS